MWRHSGEERGQSPRGPRGAHATRNYQRSPGAGPADAPLWEWAEPYGIAQCTYRTRTAEDMYVRTTISDHNLNQVLYSRQWREEGYIIPAELGPEREGKCLA